MTSPARRHFLRHVAAKAAVDDGGGLRDATHYERMLMKLGEDKRRLKQIQSKQVKAEYKRKVLPDYLPWVEGVLAAGSGLQDGVLMTVMLWAVDAGCYEMALTIGAYALRFKLAMPDNYKRDTANTLAEEIADAAKRARDEKTAFDAAVLKNALSLTEACDMFDPVRAKLLKETGLAIEQADPQAALEYLARAKSLDDRVGVVKDIERITRNLKNSAGNG